MALVNGQATTGSISGTVVDAGTGKPVPAAWVLAVSIGLPPLTKNTKTGGNGAFVVEGLAPGRYSLCVQAQANSYVDPCQWSTAAPVEVATGQNTEAVTVRLVPASVVSIQLHDTEAVLSRRTKDGRLPELSAGVWGPRGLYYPARKSPRVFVAPGGSRGALYEVAIPRGVPVRLAISSRDVVLGDATGRALAGNADQQTFQVPAGDVNPRNFVYWAVRLVP